MNSLFLAKSQFQRDVGGTNKKLPINSVEESSLVAGIGEISNFKLLLDIKEIVGFLSR